MSNIQGIFGPAATPTPFFDAQGRQIFPLKTGQGLIVVEGVPGLSLAAPGKLTSPGAPDNRPDLQIETTQAMGNGSAAVCDDGNSSKPGHLSPAGGIFPIATPNFTLEPNPGPTPGTVTGALNDFGCRFEEYDPGFLCTFFGDTGTPRYLGTGTVGTNAVQFCAKISSSAAAFNPGDSIVTVRLRDINGNTGPTAQIVVRVSTPTPTP